MKQQLELELDLPRAAAVEFFGDVDNLSKWQPGLISYEHLSGEPGTPGAKSLLKYKLGGRELEMVETILESNLPDKFAGVYETAGLSTEMVYCFAELDHERTKWTVTADPKATSFFMKLMGWLMPGMCAKETLKFMHQFKIFAEAEYNQQQA